MKKRILAFILSIVMLMSMASLGVFATDGEVPTLSNTTPKTSTDALDMTKLISGGLTASPEFSATSGGDLTATQKADIADLDYGVSVIGMKVANRPVSCLVDHVWSTGNAGATQSNGKTVEGCFDMKPDAKAYDLAGVAADANDADDDSDNIYYGMITFNFGTQASITSFALVCSWTKHAAYDILVSNDGISWETVAVTSGVANADVAGNAPAVVGVDKLGNAMTASNSVTVFEFPTAVTGQYFRIANKNSNPAGYSLFKTDLREILVFGSTSDIAVDGTQTTAINASTNSYDARFVASVNKNVLTSMGVKSVSKITLKIAASYTDTENITPVEIAAKSYDETTVYTGIMAGDTLVSAANGTVYALVEITGIPADVDVTFTVTPVIVYANGGSVTGATATFEMP